ncbi:MAG TPA: hypothetical protein PLY69_05050 [Bacteroidales bacterium]|nr:hypothetical protein [Bacteroidales bacterium]HOR60412.1 hypothetical protein [Bacteroidales bacterium]
MMRKKIKKKQIKILLFILLFVAIPFVIYILGNIFENRFKNKETIITGGFKPISFFLSFENNEYLNETHNITNLKFLSGRKSVFIDQNGGQSPIITIPIPDYANIKYNNINCNFWLLSDTSFINSLFVFAIVDTNNIVLERQERAIEAKNLNSINWYNFNENFNIPTQYLNSRHFLQMFIYNTSEQSSNLYFDDLEIVFEKENEIHKTKALIVDFEDDKFKKISSKYYFSGNFSSYASGINDYSEPITLDFEDINYKNLKKILLNLNYLSESEDLDAVFIVSICDTSNTEIFCSELELPKNKDFKIGNWENITTEIVTPKSIIDKGSYFKFYLWNKNSNTVFVDDIYMIFKEFSIEYGNKPTAHNFVLNPNFQIKKNQAPYNFYYLNREKQFANKGAELSKFFTDFDKILIGNYRNDTNLNQILAINANDIVFYDFKNQTKIKHNLQNLNSLQFFTDGQNIFLHQTKTKNIGLYKINFSTNSLDLETEMVYNFENKISEIFTINDSIISIFDNLGNVYDYLKKDGKYSLIKTSKLISCSEDNLKLLKSNFYSKETEEVLIIFQEKGKVKYEFFNYCINKKEWQHSINCSNKSTQYFDKLDFQSEYFLIDYNGDGIFELLKFDRTNKFNLKLLDFDFRSYKILYEIDFKGFENSQNPKYYEKVKILTGNFTNDQSYEVMIFQDNVNKVDWLNQKTEIYSFGK